MKASINLSQSIVLGTGVAAPAVCILGAVLFFSTMEDGRAQHFASTETIVEYQKRVTQQALDVGISREYELKINGVRVETDVYIAWWITVRYIGYLPKPLVAKWIKAQRDKWNKERPHFWEDPEWRKRALEVSGLEDLGYVPGEGETGAPKRAVSWQEKAGLQRSSKVLPAEKAEMKEKKPETERRGSFAQLVAQGGEGLAKLIQSDLERRLDNGRRQPKKRASQVDRDAALDKNSGLRAPESEKSKDGGEQDGDKGKGGDKDDEPVNCR